MASVIDEIMRAHDEEKDAEIERLEKQHDKFLQEFWKTNAENERLRAALERIANPITDDEVHWINTDEIVSIAKEALQT